MREVLVARQPLFDPRLKVVGYELLFRDGRGQVARVRDAERATAAVVLNTFTELGLERMTGGRPAWINVSREFILAGLAASLPADLVVLEILEDQLIDEELVAAVRSLKEQGYRLALDDFEYAPSADPLLEIVDVVKLDVLALGGDGLERACRRLRPLGVQLLAEKVETHEEFARCLQSGCELFQGYFFCRPELVGTRSVDASRMSLLTLLAALNEPGIGLRELERTIALDLALGYRVLRYINSAFFGLRHEVRSIGQALALLGVERLRHWVALSVFAGVDRKPPELTITALVRARFCELADGGASAGGSERFTLGLFSLVDALLDMPMSEVVKRVPFAEDTSDALVGHEGAKGRLLSSVIALEHGDLELAERLVPGAAGLYMSAVQWADLAASALLEPVATNASAA